MTESDLPATLNPTAWLAQTRADMLDAAGLQPDDLQRTVRRHRKLLNAKRTKFFAHEGVVTDQRDVDDLEVQARAVELFYDLLGVKAPKVQNASASAGVEIVIDPTTGQVIVRAVTK